MSILPVWSDSEAGCRKSPLALRAYTSRLIGKDPALVLHGGGNTSLKLDGRLYVKGTGANLAHVEEGDFTALDLDALRRRLADEHLSDATLMQGIDACKLDPAAPKPSIATLLHAVLPHAWVEHAHADAVLVYQKGIPGAISTGRARYLKRKAINCGQLDEPVDCNLLAPIPVINTTRFCVTTPPSTQIISSANASTVPSASAQNTNNTYTLYKDGVMIDTQFVVSGSYDYLFSGTLASAGLYEVEITNQFGCTARSAPVQIDAYQVPTVTAAVVDSTIPCVPPPIGGPGDGEITLTVTNPVPGYTYTFRLCYDLGPPIFLVCYPDQTSVSVSATFTGLCPARYWTLRVQPPCCVSKRWSRSLPSSWRAATPATALNNALRFCTLNVDASPVCT